MYNIKLALINIMENHKISLGNKNRQCLGSLLLLLFIYVLGEDSLLFLCVIVMEVLSGEVTFEKKSKQN